MALWDTMENFVNESIKFSKQAYEKAKDLGNLTKKEFALKSLQTKVQKEFTKLGGVVHRLFVDENNESIVPANEDVKTILDSIQSLEDEMKQTEQEIAELKQDMKKEAPSDEAPSDEVSEEEPPAEGSPVE
jgi:hypothetical protein